MTAPSSGAGEAHGTGDPGAANASDVTEAARITDDEEAAGAAAAGTARGMVIGVRGNPTPSEVAVVLAAIGRRPADASVDPYRRWRATRRAALRAVPPGRPA